MPSDQGPLVQSRGRGKFSVKDSSSWSQFTNGSIGLMRVTIPLSLMEGG